MEGGGGFWKVERWKNSCDKRLAITIAKEPPKPGI